MYKERNRFATVRWLSFAYSQLHCLPITTINYLINKHVSCPLSPLDTIIVNYGEVVYYSITGARACAYSVSVCTAPKKGTFTVHASGAMKHCTCLQLLSCPAATANTCSSPFFVTLSRSQDRRIIVQPLQFQPLLLAPLLSPPVSTPNFSSATARIILPSSLCAV